jgi:hypothetical protein
MKAVLLVLAAPLLAGAARVAPLPVTSIGGIWNTDGTITLNWTVPADPTVTAIRIFRERLDLFDEVIIEIVGVTTSYTDTSAHRNASYRYWVQTKNGLGQLSNALFIEFIDEDDTRSHWSCSAGIGGGPDPIWPWVLGAALAVAATGRKPKA